MDTNYLAFVTADPDFYDVEGSKSPADLGVEVAQSARRQEWTVSADGPWILHLAPTPLPRAGWKVHVSARPERVQAVVAATLEACHELGVSAKHLRSRRLVWLTQAKYAPQASAGKVVTAYPATAAQLDELVAQLARRLRGEPGARVLSDLPVPGVPIGLRYGAFRSTWVAGEDGRTVPGVSDAAGSRPDRRAAHRATAGAPQPWPAIVQRISAANAAAASAAIIDLQEVRLLHRSNAGGVYRGRWADGREVVVKEARHHTGFDAGEVAAVDRLRHEHAALLALSGTGVAPAAVDYLTVGDSDMLVMEYVAGPTAATAMATRHPGVLPATALDENDEQDATTGYLAWCDTFMRRARDGLRRAHEAGVEHRDIHPANMVETDRGVVFIDWESSSVSGSVVASGIAAARLASGTDDVDGAGLLRLETTLVNPMAFLLDRRPELESELLRVGRSDLAAGGHLTQRGERPADAAEHAARRNRVRVGLSAVATPDRSDRLFPGDVAQFQSPAGGLGLLHGAAGVLLAMDLSRLAEPDQAGRPEPWPDWCDWLIAAAERAEPSLRGWADGLDGVAVALARIGERDAAVRLARKLLAPDPQLTAAPWWGAGRAGMAVAAAELSNLLGGDAPIRTAALAALEEHVRGVLAAVDADPPGARPGLIAGWSGVAAGLLRVAELVPALALECREGAATALGREYAGAHQVRGGLLLAQGRALMPYLANGSAALGYVVAAADSQHVELPGLPAPSQVCAQVARSLRCPVVPDAGLMLGRAGNLMVLEQLSPGDSDAGHHRDRLAWHLVPGAKARTVVPGDLVLGNQHLRFSADLATGAAGVLLALHPTSARSRGKLIARALGLPRIHMSHDRNLTDDTVLDLGR